MTQDEVINGMSKELCEVIGTRNVLTKGEILRLNQGSTVMPIDMVASGVLRKNASGYRVANSDIVYKLLNRSRKND